MLNTQRVVQQHEVNRLMGLVQAHRHDHALASSQSVGLDDDGGADLLNMGVGQRSIAERGVGGSGDAVAPHEVFGEGLGALELRSSLGRSKDAKSPGTEQVDHASRQRALGSDHGQANLLLLSEICQRLDIGEIDVDQTRVTRGTAIARRNIDLLDPWALRQLPGQRMLAATAADHQNLHSPISALWKTSCTSSRSSSTSSSFCMRSASSPASGMVFSARIVTSATSDLKPAASSAAFSAS